MQSSKCPLNLKIGKLYGENVDAVLEDWGGMETRRKWETSSGQLIQELVIKWERERIGNWGEIEGQKESSFLFFHGF